MEYPPHHPLIGSSSPPPRNWCIRYEQLLQVEELAIQVFGREAFYQDNITMRDICHEIILPRCQKSGRSYALSVNPDGLPSSTSTGTCSAGNGTGAIAFITHSWDGPFSSFVQSVCHMFQTTLEKPHLWICAFALNQASLDEHEGLTRPQAPLEESPFVQALQGASLFCVIRNANTDLCSRLWCVCELHFAKQLGLFPHKTHIAGPNVFQHSKASCLDAQATKAQDEERILRALLYPNNKGSSSREEIDRVVQLFRNCDPPQPPLPVQVLSECPLGSSAVEGASCFDNHPQQQRERNFHSNDNLKALLHPLHGLDHDLIEQQMVSFQPGTREWAIQSFDDWIASSNAKSDNHANKCQIFVLMAQAGVGKTGIVCRIAQQRSSVILALHFCRHDDIRRSNPKHVLCEM